MKLSKFKQHLHNLNALTFILPCGSAVPAHFHITEVAKNDKHFIDCGGIIRHETRIGFQLWVAHDTEHRLSPAKLLSIIRLSERKLDLPDAEIEVEYQYQTIGKYHLSFSDGIFRLENTLTACLAPDQCGIPQQKPRIRLGNSLCKK